MIQEAHVGLGTRIKQGFINHFIPSHVFVLKGIMGKEGRQAVRCSDFAFARFHFLRRVLLVHGQWYYWRISTLVQYFFYKSMAFSTSVVFFTMFSAYSTQVSLAVSRGWNWWRKWYSFFPIYRVLLLARGSQFMTVFFWPCSIRHLRRFQSFCTACWSRTSLSSSCWTTFTYIAALPATLACVGPNSSNGISLVIIVYFSNFAKTYTSKLKSLSNIHIEKSPMLAYSSIHYSIIT